MVHAGVCNESFGKASQDLLALADLEISDERIRRATRRVGADRIQQRQARIDEWAGKLLPMQAFGKPANASAPPIACVMADGGRLQVLDRKQPSSPGEHWRESRVATFLSLESKPHEVDPTPELPAFLRNVSIAKKLAAMGHVPGKNEAKPATKSRTKRSQETPWPRPPILKKTMQASAVCWEEFGPLMASHAWYEGFSAATQKVFVSDGSLAIEKVQQRYFSHYTSVLDLLHALSYSLAAARASTSDRETSWRRYVQWAEWIWQGNVDQVIEELTTIQEEIGSPEKGTSADDPREIVRRSRVYYSNHRGRMNYPEYRRRGFPLTSSIMESSVKQISRRVKGTEKFWSTVGGEALLTLRADYLSDAQPMANYWAQAQSTATGQREYRQAT